MTPKEKSKILMDTLTRIEEKLDKLLETKDGKKRGKTTK